MQSGTFRKAGEVHWTRAHVRSSGLLQCQAMRRVKWEVVGFFWSGLSAADVTFTLLFKSKEIQNYVDVIET